MYETKKGAPTGVERDVSNVEGGESEENGQMKRRQKWYAARGCRCREGPGEQVEGYKTASAETVGGGRQERGPVQVDRRS